MKKVEVVIHGESFDVVHQALRDRKVGAFCVSELKVFDPALPPEGCFRGARYPIGHELVRLDWILRDQEVERTLEAVREGLDALGGGHADVVVHAIEDPIRLSASVWTRARVAR